MLLTDLEARSLIAACEKNSCAQIRLAHATATHYVPRQTSSFIAPVVKKFISSPSVISPGESPDQKVWMINIFIAVREPNLANTT